MSKKNDKGQFKTRALTWKEKTTSALDTWEADTPLGRFTLSRRFIGDEMYLCTPPLNGVINEITCTNFDDGNQKAEDFIGDLVVQLTA